MEKVELKVLGMNCPHCENRVVKAVMALQGANNCEANHKKKRVIVEFDANVLNKESIIEQIKEAGYIVK